MPLPVDLWAKNATRIYLDQILSHGLCQLGHTTFPPNHHRVITCHVHCGGGYQTLFSDLPSLSELYQLPSSIKLDRLDDSDCLELFIRTEVC